MRTIHVEYDYDVYTFDELSEEAKERAIQDYRERESDIRNEFFYNDIKQQLDIDFPNSELDVTYSLSYCQGDGLNIYGELLLADYLDSRYANDYLDTFEIKELQNYLNINSNTDRFIFERNNHYFYSCKFIDRKYVSDEIDELIDGIEWYNDNYDVAPIFIDRELITKFYNAVIDTFENLDTEYEKQGYSYIYGEDIDEQYMSELSYDNGYEYDINGVLEL